jgi:hypothetical protein
MKKNEILEEGKEALQRTLLMMKYDMKKTLTENVEVINEQGNEDQEIANLLYSGAHGSLGTKENKLIDGFSKIKNANQYQNVEKLYAAYGREKTLQDMLRSELGNDDLDVIEKIKKSLDSVGVSVNYKPGQGINQNVFDYNTLTISTTGGTNKTSDDKTDTQKPVKKSDAAIKAFANFSCVSNHPRAKESKMTNGSPVFFIDGEVYYNNGRKKDKSGKMVAFTCNDVIFKTSGGKKTVPAITDQKLLSTLNFEYKFPGDNTYVYDFVPSATMTEQTNKGGTWYAKNLKTGKVFNISQYYPQTEKKLNTEFPSAANPIDKSPKETSTEPVEPALPNPPPAPDLNAAAGLEPPKLQNDMKNVQKESLKKSLKKNLMEVRENKENIMVETNIVEKRFKFIVEGKTFETEKEQDFLIESVISEIGYLKAQGYTPKAINEGLFSMLGSLLGGAATSAPAVFGEYIAGWLTKQLGIPQNSYMNGVIVSLVGNLNIADYDRFFSDCRFASNKVADSLIEGYLLQLQNEKNLNTGASGFIVSALRNSVVDYFAEDKNSLIQILEDKIGEFICPKLSKLSSVIGDKAKDIKAKAVA